MEKVKKVKSNKKDFYSSPKLIKLGYISDNTLGSYAGTNDPSGAQVGGKTAPK